MWTLDGWGSMWNLLCQGKSQCLSLKHLCLFVVYCSKYVGLVLVLCMFSYVLMYVFYGVYGRFFKSIHTHSEFGEIGTTKVRYNWSIASVCARLCHPCLTSSLEAISSKKDR